MYIFMIITDQHLTREAIVHCFMYKKLLCFIAVYNFPSFFDVEDDISKGGEYVTGILIMSTILVM